jgi:hypothetical protein
MRGFHLIWQRHDLLTGLQAGHSQPSALVLAFPKWADFLYQL